METLSGTVKRKAYTFNTLTLTCPDDERIEYLYDDGQKADVKNKEDLKATQKAYDKKREKEIKEEVDLTFEKVRREDERRAKSIWYSSYAKGFYIIMSQLIPLYIIILILKLWSQS